MNPYQLTLKNYNMETSLNKMSKQLIHLKLAYEAQQIAKPYVKQGVFSLSCIYLNHIAGEVPVCMNTFRKMMKEDVSDYPVLAQAYKEKVAERYFERLKKKRNKR